MLLPVANGLLQSANRGPPMHQIQSVSRRSSVHHSLAVPQSANHVPQCAWVVRFPDFLGSFKDINGRAPIESLDGIPRRLLHIINAGIYWILVNVGPDGSRYRRSCSNNSLPETM